MPTQLHKELFQSRFEALNNADHRYPRKVKGFCSVGSKICATIDPS